MLSDIEIAKQSKMVKISELIEKFILGELCQDTTI